MVKLLIDNGADVNPPTDTPPLRAAVRAKYEEGVELLIDSGANPNVFDRATGTTLHDAVADENLSMVKLLIDGGADVNGGPQTYRSILSIAVCGCNIEMLHVLVQRGADINRLDSSDQNAARYLMRYQPPASSWRPPASSASSPASASASASASSPAPAPAPGPVPYTGGYPPASYETQYMNPWGSQTPTPPAAGMGYAPHQPQAPPRNPSNQYNAPPADPRAQVVQPYSWNQ